MKTFRALVPALLLVAAAPTLARGAASTADTLSFEVLGPDSGFAGWDTMEGTVSQDSTTVHGGRYAARFQRGPSASGEFSAISRAVPITFSGDTLEVRGWLKTDGVVGFAGLWLREDAKGGHRQFDNMEKRALRGTTPWTEYRVALPLDKHATTIAFGALLGGQGTVHADDLRLLVDGKPIAEAPPFVRVQTVVDRDHEFDQGSGIDAVTISPVQAENLVLLGKVWGFLKYHHPRVTAGEIHWDYELFRVLPSVLKAKDRREATRALVKWLDRVGKPEACRTCAAPPRAAHLLPRIEWIDDRARLGADLSERLKRIHRNRNAADEQFYVSLFEGVQNPDFSTEGSYARLTLPDFGYRLLGLYRFWNIIEYWFPYRDLVGGDWDSVLAEFVPRLATVTSRDAYRLEMIALVARAHDGHANVWNALDARQPQGQCRLPFVAWPVEGRFVVGKYTGPDLSRASGFQIGDVILEVDGVSVDSLAVAWAPYYGASNESARRRDMARALSMGPCGSCRITVERVGQRLDVAGERDSIRVRDPEPYTHDRPGDTFQVLAKDVAYLKLSSVKVADIPSYLERAAGTKCLVIDIRNYPSEFVPFALGQHLVDRTMPFARFTHGDTTNPGAFLWGDSAAIEPASPRYEGAIVILVDDTSQSQAEYTAMALRTAPRAIVVGSTTAGADGNVSAIPLPGGLRGMISGIGVFYPDKSPTQRIGIVPDITVLPTVNGIRSGHDEVLEAALKHVLGRDMPILRP